MAPGDAERKPGGLRSSIGSVRPGQQTLTRRTFKRGGALLALGSVALSLALVELILHAVGASPASGIHFTAKLKFYRLDPDLIWSFVPNSALTWGTDEFTETTSINSLGLRGPEVPQKQTTDRRVLALGDSFTYGHGMAQTGSYPAVLEDLLRSGRLPVTVLNAGTPGYSVDQSYRAFLARWLELEPDLVIVGVTAGDVIYDSDKSLYEIRNGELVALDATRNPIYLQGVLYRAVPWPVDRLKLFRFLAASVSRIDPFRQMPRGSAEELAGQMRRKIELELEDIDRIGHAKGYRTLAVLMPCRDDQPGLCAAAFADLGPRLRAAGIAVLDGTAALGGSGPDFRRLFFPKDGHLTAEGNRLLAGRVADLILREELLGLPGGAGSRPG